MTVLAIPDPKQAPVPQGWFEQIAAPVLAKTDSWDELDDYESKLRGMAAYIDSFEGDATEFEKALRMVEKRRADLWGDKPYPRVGTELAKQSTFDRWRKIAKHWDKVLWPHILQAKNRNADAKTELRDDTPNHAIEIRSVECHIRLERAFPRITIYYVWHDFTICTPNWLKDNSKPYTGKTTGSGTPLLLTPKKLQWSFDAFFGLPKGVSA